MKRMCLLVCLAIFGTALFGISGHITQDTTWDTNQIVTGVLYVDAGVTLTIMSGVQVTFPRVDQNADGIGDVYIEVSGRLQVQGTLTNKVIFTSNQTTPARSDWLGIKYITPQSGMLSTISNAEIRYAHEPIFVNGRNMTLNNVRIAYSGSYGMRINNTFLTTTLTNCTIEENTGYGLLVETGPVNITGLVLFHNGSYGIKILNEATVTATDIVSSTNTDTGIWVVDDQEASFTNCRSISNGKYGVWLDGASTTFTNCDFSNNSDFGVFVDRSTANPVFNHCTIKANNFAGIVFRLAQGTLSYSNIFNNVGAGIFIIKCQPIVQFCNIYNNQGGQSGLVTSGTWNINQTFPGVIGLSRALLADFSYAKDASIQYSLGGSAIHYHFVFNTRATYLGTQYLANNIDVDMYAAWAGAGYPNGWGYDFPYSVFSHTFDVISNNLLDLTFTGEWNQYVPSPMASVLSCDYYYFGGSYKQATIVNNATQTVNMNNNYWGQVNGVDSLVVQKNSGTASYQTMETAFLTGSGCTLSNLSPTMNITAPTSMILNPTTYNITWTDRDLDDNAMIALYYTENPAQPGTLIVNNISEDSSTNSYTWNCAAVPAGTYYIKAVISDGVNTPVSALSTGRIMVGGLQVKMPINATGVAGTSVSIPVQTVNTVDYFNIISFQFTMTYNTNIIQATGINTDGTLTGETWTVYANTSTPGQVSVNGFSTQPLNSSGNLVNIVFNVLPGAVNYATSPLNFADCVLNAGTPVATLVNGVFRVVNQYSISGNVKYYMGTNIPIPNTTLTLTGDQTYTTTSGTNGNFAMPPVSAGNYVLTPSCNTAIQSLVITPYDAALTAQFALGLYTFTNNQQKAADVNGDNSATVFDAALIAQYSVGLITSFTPGRWGFNPVNQSYNLVSNFTNVQFLGYAIGDPSGNWISQPAQNGGEMPITIATRNGNSVSIPIEWTQPFVSGYVQLRYNPEQLRYVDTEYASSMDDMQHFSNTENGTLRISTFGVTPVTCNEPVFNLQFEIIDNSVNSSSIVYMQAIQFDEVAVDLNSVGIIPTETPTIPLQLNQNYPNPFNPITNISYSLPRKSDVRLSIFNMKGQLVKELVNENKPAGSYTISLNASNMASGIYFYRLDTDTDRIIRKMVLMK